MLPDRERQLRRLDFSVRLDRGHEGRHVDHRGERGEPVLVDVLRSVEAEDRVREVRLHQLRDPGLPIAQVLLERQPALAVGRPKKDGSGGGR